MRLRFSVEVLSNPEAWDALDELVFLVWRGVHVWDVPDYQSIENSNWIAADIGSNSGNAEDESGTDLIPLNGCQ